MAESPQPQGGSVASSLRSLCGLLCWPPLPSAIAAKLAFQPPEASYHIRENDTGSQASLELVEGRAEWPYSGDELRSLEAFYTQTARGNRLACLHLPCASGPLRPTILFSHGNAVDLGQIAAFYYGLGMRLDANLLAYDYSGYGASSGKPSERNLYADIAAVWDVARNRLGLSPEKILVYGQSIGTVPSVDLAARERVGGLVLHSPLMSGLRVAFPETQRTWCFDAFPSIEKIPRVSCPTLVIHGTEDEVIDFSHGLGLYERCPQAVEPLWVPGAGHNDVEMHAEYLQRLKRFLNQEMAKSEANGDSQ